MNGLLSNVVLIAFGCVADEERLLFVGRFLGGGSCLSADCSDEAVEEAMDTSSKRETCVIVVVL